MKKLIILLILALQSCAVTSLTHVYPDGSQDKFSALSLWANPSISGLDIANGDRHLKLDSFSRDETTGLESFNRALPGIVGAAVKAAIEGAK